MLLNEEASLSLTLVVRNLCTLVASYYSLRQQQFLGGIWSSAKSLSPEQLTLIGVRSILSYVALATSYESLRSISLGLYGAIHTMQPLISYIVGYCMLNRSMHLTEVANLHVSALAVYLIAKGEAPD
jgi:hypothetical protein